MFTLELLFLKLSENTILRLDTALGLDWAQPVVVALRWDRRHLRWIPRLAPAQHPRADCVEPGFSLDFCIFAELRVGQGTHRETG